MRLAYCLLSLAVLSPDALSLDVRAGEAVSGLDTVVTSGTDSLMMDIDEIVFVGERNTSAVRGSMISSIKWKLDGMEALPKILGNADPVRYLQFLPGVQVNSEFDSGIHIQGCDNSHNEISIAGVPLYGVSHLFGFFSVFNPSHFPGMEFSGATNVVPSGRIGGTVSMSLPDYVPGKVSGDFSLGIMSAQGTLKIPLGKKAGVFVSARRSFMNLLYKRWLKFDGASVRYGFGDYDLTWYWQPTEKDRIWVDGYFGKDNVAMDEAYFVSKIGVDWSNHLAAAHWEHRFSDRLEMRHTLFWSGQRFGLEVRQDDLYLAMPSHIESIGYRGKVRHGDFESGADVIMYDVMPQAPKLDGTYNGTVSLPEMQTGLEASVHTVYERTFGYRWRLKAGLVGSMFMSPEKEFFWNASPAASLSFLMYRAGTLTASCGCRHQYLFQTGLTNLGLPTEFWFLSGKHSRPQTSGYVSLGYEVPLFRDAVRISAEAYYKKLYNQVDYKGDLFDFLNSSYSLDDMLLKGSGQNYGFSLMVHKQTGKLTGWLGYTFGRALRRFVHPDYPSLYPANHERPHEFTAVAAYSVGKWDFGATFVCASGTPFTAPKSFYIVSGVIMPEYGEHNACRLPPYIRLDLSVNYSIIRNERRECGLNFSLYNATARDNYLMYRLKVKDGRFAYSPMGFFLSFVPSVSYYHKF